MAAKLFDSTLFSNAQEALDFISNILESSTEYSIIGKDLDGTILLWNEGARRLYGYEPEEVVGKLNASILHRPEDVQNGTPREIMESALRNGKWEGSITRQRRNREQFIARVVMTPRRDASGNPIGFLLISKDISEEIRLAEQLQATHEAMLELSTPVLQLRERLLMLPIVGVIDSQRAQKLTEQLLRSIRANRAKVVVIDITGVPVVDTTVANHLVQTVEASRLMGANVIITGLSADIARTLVMLGVDLGKMDTLGDLQEGIEEAERLLGYDVRHPTPDSDEENDEGARQKPREEHRSEQHTLTLHSRR